MNASTTIKVYGFTAVGDKIIQAVIDCSGTQWSEIKSVTRTRPVVWHRQACMYLVKKYTSMSLGAVGKPFSGKDHATVLHAKRTIRDLYESNYEVRELIDEVENLMLQRGVIRKIVAYDRESFARDYTKPLLSVSPEKWTEGEVIILDCLYEKYNTKQIATWLNRSESSVKNKIGVMGIDKPPKQIQLIGKSK